MFVAVLSRKNETKTRSDLREMWQSAGQSWGAQVTAKFAVCRHADEPNAPSTSELQEEADKFGDILQMNCTDRYERGGLTRKVRNIMKIYIEEYMATHPLFMKIDDDSYVSLGKLCRRMRDGWTALQELEGQQLYMGVFWEEPENWASMTTPVRDNTSNWFEPWSVFWEDFYPYSAKGGPGYILTGDMVKQFFDQGIVDQNMLYNEDKAVGVWVDKLKQKSVNIKYLHVRGTDGYYFHQVFWEQHTTGNWGSFPYTMFHKLSGPTINCLHRLDAGGDPESQVDACWK